MTWGTFFGIVLFCALYMGGIALFAWCANHTELTLIPKLKRKISRLFEQAREYREIAEYRRFQQRCYDRRKRENRPWDED